MLSFTKTYELPLAKTYVRHWGMLEAVREIIQNALDSESPFEYEFIDDRLIVRSRFAKLSPQTLLLGTTSKADNADTIGSFGEGYKIALLVLVRAGYPVVVHNGDRDWTPAFKFNRQFEAETLCITDSSAGASNEGVAFEIGGLSGADIEAVKASCLHMQPSIGEVIETPLGRILVDRKGMLYVGGLFVCETELEYGYDMKPAHLKLERDRQTVSTFDLQFLTKAMWFHSKRIEQVAKMIADEVPDMKYAQYDTPELVKEECYRIFQEQNPGKIVATSRAELEEKLRQGMKHAAYISGSFGEVVKSSQAHRKQSFVRVPQPAEILAEFLKKHRYDNMRKQTVAEMEALIKTARRWTIGNAPVDPSEGDDSPF